MSIMERITSMHEPKQGSLVLNSVCVILCQTVNLSIHAESKSLPLYVLNSGVQEVHIRVR